MTTLHPRRDGDIHLMCHYQDAAGNPGVFLYQPDSFPIKASNKEKLGVFAAFKGAVGAATITLCGETVDTFDAQENN